MARKDVTSDHFGLIITWCSPRSIETTPLTLDRKYRERHTHQCLTTAGSKIGEFQLWLSKT
jgi:hypothetical protein